jgi:hypothetical protein
VEFFPKQIHWWGYRRSTPVCCALGRSCTCTSLVVLYQYNTGRHQPHNTSEINLRTNSLVGAQTEFHDQLYDFSSRQQSTTQGGFMKQHGTMVRKRLSSTATMQRHHAEARWIPWSAIQRNKAAPCSGNTGMERHRGAEWPGTIERSMNPMVRNSNKQRTIDFEPN